MGDLEVRLWDALGELLALAILYGTGYLLLYIGRHFTSNSGLLGLAAIGFFLFGTVIITMRLADLARFVYKKVKKILPQLRII